MQTGTKLNIVSFNVLSRQYSPLQMLLKKHVGSKDQVKPIIKNEIKRFNLLVGPKLIKYFKLILPTSIICLQEVNGDFLNLIKQNFNSEQIFYTNTTDYTIQQNKKKISKNFNDDHRIIIIPDYLIKHNGKSKDIQIINSFASKSGLFFSLSFDDYNLVIINLHLHWKMTLEEMSTNAEKIIGELKKSFVNLEKLRIIICGDFNKGIKKVENFFQKSLNSFGFNFTNNYSLNETGFTSHSTDPTDSIEYDIIDHILTHNIQTITQTQIISEIADKTIIYDSKQVADNTMEDLETNISDHNLIKLQIKF